MRIWNMLRGDIRFQWKYGFYFVYTIFTVFYILLLRFIPESVRQEVGSILWAQLYSWKKAKE